jgi:hypothetical protein
MIQRLRIFLSSPGDLASAREIAAHTIEKLAQDYGRHFQTIEPYIWQHEAMLASKHFQDSIELPSAFDIVGRQCRNERRFANTAASMGGRPSPARSRSTRRRWLDDRPIDHGRDRSHDERRPTLPSPRAARRCDDRGRRQDRAVHRNG